MISQLYSFMILSQIQRSLLANSRIPRYSTFEKNSQKVIKLILVAASSSLRKLVQRKLCVKKPANKCATDPPFLKVTKIAPTGAKMPNASTVLWSDHIFTVGKLSSFSIPSTGERINNLQQLPWQLK